MAFHMVQPVPAATWSTRRYRPASRVPGSEVKVLICQRQEWARPSASLPAPDVLDHRAAGTYHANLRLAPQTAPGAAVLEGPSHPYTRNLAMVHTRTRRGVPELTR